MNIQTPPERLPTRRRVTWRLMVGVLLATLGIGLLGDACSGMPITRGATSWPARLSALIGLGALYLVGEAAGEWIASRDAVTDPLLIRVLRVVAILAMSGGLLWVVWLLTARK